MVFTLHRYIFRDLVKTFLLASLVLSVILGLGIMLRPLRQFGVNPTKVPELIFYTLPITLTMVMPIAALFSATLNYGRLAVDNEINACRSSGIGLLTLIYPALTLALLVGMATLLLAFHVIPTFTRHFDEILKTDAEAILYRNIARTGSLGDFGGKFSRYRLHADRAIPSEHRLENVVVVQVDGDQIEQVNSAREVNIEFQTHEDQQRVTLILRDGYQVSMDDNEYFLGQINSMEIHIPIPSIWKDDVKFKKLSEMQRIREDMTQFKPVREMLDSYRNQLIIESFFQWCSRQLRRDVACLDLRVEQDRLRIWAKDCQVKKPKKRSPNDPEPPKPGRQKVNSANLIGTGQGTIKVDHFYDNRRQPERRYESQKVRLVLKLHSNRLTATLLIEEAIRTDAGDPREYGVSKHAITNIEIPAEVKTPAYAYGLDDVLAQQAHPIYASAYLDRLYRRLNRLCTGLETEIVVELHSRLAFGVSCVVLVLFGSALGIFLRSGHLLSAFGLSCIPAVLCLTTIFTGKHVAESSGSGMTSGIIFLWSGIAVVALADLWIFRHLLKR